jgi:Zn ribbon nucleic-acid-binding protein
MSKTMCPGQDMQFWKPGDVFEVECPACGGEVEFFKDDSARRCSSCGYRMKNPRLDMGCAEYCPYAKECLGYDPKVGQTEDSGESLADKLTKAMKQVFGRDQRRIHHALKVYEHAQEILRAEGGDPRVVTAAAILHDIGIPAAEKKHQSSAGRFQEKEGPPIARAIMNDYDVPADVIEHVTKIIANHHSAKDIDTPEFRIIWDADWLVNLPDEFDLSDKTKTAARIDKLFKTPTGRAKARELYV